MRFSTFTAFALAALLTGSTTTLANVIDVAAKSGSSSKSVGSVDLDCLDLDLERGKCPKNKDHNRDKFIIDHKDSFEI